MNILGLLKSLFPFLRELFLETEDGKLDKSAARRYLFFIVIFVLLFTDIRDKVISYITGRDPWVRPAEYREVNLRDPYLDYLHKKSADDDRALMLLRAELNELRLEIDRCTISGEFKDMNIEQLMVRIADLQTEINMLREQELRYRILLNDLSDKK